MVRLSKPFVVSPKFCSVRFTWALLNLLLLFWCSAPTKSHAEDFPNPDTSGLPVRTLIADAPLRTVPDWVKTNLRIGHLPAEMMMANAYADAGYNVITINATWQWDRVGPGAILYDQTTVDNADAYLRQFVAKVHGAGARAILYIGPMQIPAFSPQFKAAHPDWMRVNSNGTTDTTFLNIRSGYAEWLMTQLRYVVKTYGVDGFWLDGFAPVHCNTYDAATKAAFRAYSGGQEIPTSFDPVNNAVARLYLDWHEKFFIDIADRMRSEIRAENPDAVIFANYSANRTWYIPGNTYPEYPANYANAIDIPSVELYWDNPGDPLYQQFCFAFMQGVTHNRGGSYWIQPNAYGAGGISSPTEIQLRGLEGYPWGITAEFVEATGREEYIKLHGDAIRAREPFMGSSEPVPYIGLVASEQTRTLYASKAMAYYQTNLLGVFRALQEKHLPVRVLTEYDLENGDLQGVRVLVLANTAVLSDRACEVIRRYAQMGGGVVATYETGMYDEKFKRRSDFALADLFHAKYLGTQKNTTKGINYNVWLGQPPQAIVDDPLIRSQMYTNWLNPGGPQIDYSWLTLMASSVKCQALTGAEIVAKANLNTVLASEENKIPTIISSTFGDGRVVYIPAAMDAAMFYTPNGYIRQILANACRWAAKDVAPPVEVKAPMLLTTTLRRQNGGGRLIVHLLNNASSWGQHSISQNIPSGSAISGEFLTQYPVRDEVIPISNIEVTCNVPDVQKAWLEPEHVELPITTQGSKSVVTVPQVEMHSMVVFDIKLSTGASSGAKYQ